MHGFLGKNKLKSKKKYRHLFPVIFLISFFYWGESAMALTLSSTAFSEQGTIPKQYTCEGKDLSPALAWKDVPSGTQSFALIMDDPDAPPGTWVHWIVYNLPANVNELKEGLPKSDDLPNGGKQGLVWGVDEFTRIGYFGPCPPPGKPHRYQFKLYALDKTLDLPEKINKPSLVQAMKNHILAETTLTGLFGR